MVKDFPKRPETTLPQWPRNELLVEEPANPKKRIQEAISWLNGVIHGLPIALLSLDSIALLDLAKSGAAGRTELVVAFGGLNIVNILLLLAARKQKKNLMEAEKSLK